MVIYPKSGHQLLYTPITSEMKCPISYTFALRIPFHLLQCQCNTCTNTINNDMIHFISPRDHIGSSILNSLGLHHCVGPSVPSLAQASPSHVVPRFEASDLPFILATGPSSQVISWSSPPWSHDSMSCLMCNELLHQHMCKHCNISGPSLPSWHMLLTHMYLWTNLLCISHKHN
jgi:hypothetical protein